MNTLDHKVLILNYKTYKFKQVRINVQFPVPKPKLQTLEHFCKVFFYILRCNPSVVTERNNHKSQLKSNFLQSEMESRQKRNETDNVRRRQVIMAKEVATQCSTQMPDKM